ncbi:hypothetical protein XENTR_v10014598 [Xenopus tropicalis]|nr:hypothetical protein XENTR_v10014598 [Xenopus tropicalis]
MCFLLFTSFNFLSQFSHYKELWWVLLCGGLFALNIFFILTLGEVKAFFAQVSSTRTVDLSLVFEESLLCYARFLSMSQILIHYIAHSFLGDEKIQLYGVYQIYLAFLSSRDYNIDNSVVKILSVTRHTEMGQLDESVHRLIKERRSVCHTKVLGLSQCGMCKYKWNKECNTIQYLTR